MPLSCVFKRNNCFCKNNFCLVEEWFYSANIGGIIDDSLLEENHAIVIYLRNGEWMISVIIEDYLLKVNRAIVILIKRKNCCCKNSFVV